MKVEQHYRCNQCGQDELVSMIKKCIKCEDEVCYDCHLINGGLCEECYELNNVKGERL